MGYLYEAKRGRNGNTYNGPRRGRFAAHPSDAQTGYSGVWLDSSDPAPAATQAHRLRLDLLQEVWCRGPYGATSFGSESHSASGPDRHESCPADAYLASRYARTTAGVLRSGSGPVDVRAGPESREAICRCRLIEEDPENGCGAMSEGRPTRASFDN
ncbi:MAG TPA: hypothetical protein VGC30_14180 [Dokdonella sp.]